MRVAILCLALLTGCGSKNTPAPSTDTESPPTNDSQGSTSDTPTDTDTPTDSDHPPTGDTEPPPPVETVGLVAPVEGPFVHGERHYYIGKSAAAYNPEEPAGTLYVLHGLGASGCDFIDRYYPAQFVLDAMARGYLVVLPETANQSGPCRYQSDTGSPDGKGFRSGDIWVDSDRAYLDDLHGNAVLVTYPELSEAPLFAAGMSAGGGVAPGFAQGLYRPLFTGVAVFSNNATAIAGLEPDQEPYDIPTFLVYGENDNTTKNLAMVIQQLESVPGGVPWAFELNRAQPLTIDAFVAPLGLPPAQSEQLANALLANELVARPDGILISGSFDPSNGKSTDPLDPWEAVLLEVLPTTPTLREKEAVLDVLRELDAAHCMPSEFNEAILDFFDASRTGGVIRDDSGNPAPCPIDAAEDNDDTVLGLALWTVADAAAQCTSPTGEWVRCLTACPGDVDLYRVTAEAGQSLAVTGSVGESLTLTIISPTEGPLGSTTEEGDQLIPLSEGTLLIRLEMASDDTTDILGVPYALAIE